MHAPLHHVAIAIAVVGVVIGIIRITIIVVVISVAQPDAKCAYPKSATMVETMMETAAVEIAALETTGCERISRHGAAANRCCASRSNRRGAEAAAS